MIQMTQIIERREEINIQWKEDSIWHQRMRIGQGKRPGLKQLCVAVEDDGQKMSRIEGVPVR
jgi:hypothetical protein